MGRVLQDIPALVEKLREQQARCHDFVAPVAYMRFDTEETETNRLEPVMRIQQKTWGIESQVHQQICGRTEIPKRYYDKLLKEKAGDLLANNVNYWFERDAAKQIKRLIRTMDGWIRGFMSNSYRPIDHLDIVTSAVQVVTGQDGVQGETKPYARGARCFGWHLSPTKLDVCFVNPAIVFDLNNPEGGVSIRDLEEQTDGGGTAVAGRIQKLFGRSAGGGSGSHLVFPAARITNSETGHGGLEIHAGLYEAVCDNTCWIGTDLVRRHIGRRLEEGIYSSETYKKMNQVIFAQTADIVRAVFDPTEFDRHCKAFKGLQDEKLEVAIADVADEVAKMPGMTEGIRDDILAAYQPIRKNQHTVLDAQRALTRAAQEVKDAEMAFALEELGGAMIEKGLDAIKS